MSYDLAVRDWYAREAPWEPQGKDAGWAEYILAVQGEVFDGKDVLNLGCFYPEDEERFAHRAKSWTAIDFTSDVISRCLKTRAATLGNVRFLQMDMTELAFPDASFDVVLDASSGDHLSGEDFDRTLAEVLRVLRSGGFFVLAYCNTLAMRALEFWGPDQVEEFGRFGYTRGDSPAEMRARLEHAGFVLGPEANAHLPRSGIVGSKP